MCVPCESFARPHRLYPKALVHPEISELSLVNCFDPYNPRSLLPVYVRVKLGLLFLVLLVVVVLLLLVLLVFSTNTIV